MKKHKVTTVFFNELFKKLPKIGWFFLPTLCSGVGKGKDLFVNFSVLNFVDQLLKNKNFHKKDDHGTDADALSLTKLLPSVAGAFMRFMKLDKPMDGKRARGALRSLLGVVQLSLLYFTLPETQELLCSSELIQALDQFCSQKPLSHLNGVKQQHSHILSLLQHG
eukprot:TRINITY_DN1656_c0_g1_i11.p1 TRINITY_DN1656_c0_g1~~TRINITY_DN1656_c0_g1_i11.p1  ORF type:complete len:165 (+),score=37.64 TRINITY_DN1656_c0_g1_i11:110-604(+)